MSLNNCTLGKDNRYFDSFYVNLFSRFKCWPWLSTIGWVTEIHARKEALSTWDTKKYHVINIYLWQYKKNTLPFQTWHQHKSEIIQFHSFSDNNFLHFHKHSWPVAVPFYQTDHHHLPMRMIILVNFLTAWKVWCFAENVHQALQAYTRKWSKHLGVVKLAQNRSQVWTQHA